MKEEKQETLQEKAADLRRQYLREYRRRNKDKVREWNSRYWERKAEKVATAKKAAP